MDKEIINSINATVQRNDILYHLGDFAGRHHEQDTIDKELIVKKYI